MRTENFSSKNHKYILNTLVAEGKITHQPCIPSEYPEQGVYSHHGIEICASEYYDQHVSWRPLGRAMAHTLETNFIGLMKSFGEEGETIPKYWFLNGKCKVSELRILESRIADKQLRRLPLTVAWAEDVSTNWDKMSPAGKAVMARWFDTVTGEYFGDRTSIRVLGVGNVQGRLSNYRRANVAEYSDQYVKKDAPIVELVTLNGTTFSFCQAEYDAFLSVYTKCSSCGDWEIKSYLVFSLCRRCAGDSPKELRGYSERATSVFGFASKSKVYSGRYLGVELEYERTLQHTLSEDLHLLYRNLKNHAIFKRDGSLSQGIEICTRPASADIQIEEFQKMFADAQCMSAIKVLPSCGMHVHIDRTKMSALSLGKMLKFMQAKDNKEFLELIAGRGDNSYCQLGTGELISGHLRGLTTERYRGLNLQNESTAEVRIFRTPETMDVFTKNIEFVTALADFVQPANSGVSECSHQALTKFVLSNRRSYPTLHKGLKNVV